MNEHWTTLPNAERVQEHAADARPAWLWSQDGRTLLWSNHAAPLFLARLKKYGLKLAQPAVPIRGQVSRVIRLGSPGRSSLARIQFLAGEKPVSITCIATPLVDENGETALLIVGVDPIEKDVLAAGAALRAHNQAETETEARPDDESAPYLHELQDWQSADGETAYEAQGGFEAPPQQQQFEADDAVTDAFVSFEPDEDVAPETEPPAAASSRLSDLVDRLSADEALYTPLNEADDVVPAAALAAFQSDNGNVEPDEPVSTTLYRVTGRGFTPLADEADDTSEPNEPVGDEDQPEPFPDAILAAVNADGETEAETVPDVAAEAEVEADDVPMQPDPETVERVSRYNFDELSRILTDRVGERSQPPAEPQNAIPAIAGAQSNTPGALINLGGEPLVLNRLPLGILVFRDQQVLFANRAITEMVGYDSVENLRQAGLAAVFPAMGDGEHEAGPVNHLVQRDGALVPVTARLQSISWQGRPALMLSASTTEVRTGHEEAVRAFASGLAETRGDGFIEANRSGVLITGNSVAASLLSPGRALSGQALSGLLGEDDAISLRAFLERPARFAETARPCIALHSAGGRANILLFALGQAGVVSGYFGFVQAREQNALIAGGQGETDPALLARISRGVRRPLNTIMGFSDLLRTKAFGDLGNERYEGYAEDISRAGQDIAALVDELDDYARLRDGRYLPQRASLDLTSLLESCVIRIREQANGARVIVRNAISETLPRVTADEASLAQAVLNLLASAIDQTPKGGAVVISAQRLDDGGIAVHVRDSSAHAVDMAERFVVFRDGVDKDGQMLAPVRSSVGLALTRSLLAVNAVSLSVDPAGVDGMLFSLKIPADLVDASARF